MQFWAPQYSKNVEVHESTKRRAQKLVTKSLPSLEKIRLSGNSTAHCSSLKRKNKGRYRALVLGTNNTT